jgi:hypothetical protein
MGQTVDGSDPDDMPPGMTSALSGDGVFELRGVVKPLVFFCRHLGLLARCHLFSRKMEILI